MRFSYLLVLMLFVQSIEVYGSFDQTVRNDQRQALQISEAIPQASTIIINNDTTWYGGVTINATDNVIVSNCTLTIVKGDLTVYGNLTVVNATIQLDRGPYPHGMRFIRFHGGANLTVQKATFSGFGGYPGYDVMDFRDWSRAVINDSTMGVFIISFGGNSAGNIYNTKIQFELSASGFARVNAINVSGGGLIYAAGSARLNVYGMSVQWSWIYGSTKVNLTNSAVDWLHAYGHAEVNLYNTTVLHFFDVYPYSPVINAYGSSIGTLRMRWLGYDVREVRGSVYLINSHVGWMMQHYVFNGSVILNETGAYGDYWQAIHLTNTTVDVNWRPLVVSVNNTEATIRDVDVSWLILYDNSEVNLRNVNMERVYAFDYSKASLRYTRVTDNLFLLPGKPKLHVLHSTICRLGMRAHPREARNLQGKTHIVNSHISYMYQFYIFNGTVTMDETGIKGNYRQAHHLVNTKVDTMLPSMIVAVGDTQAHIRNVHNIWSIFLYDNSKIWLHNSSFLYLLYMYGQGGIVWGYESDTSVYGWVIGNITINAEKQARTTLKMKTALEWVRFNITNLSSPGLVPNGTASIGTYVKIIITATKNYTAQITIHYNQKEIQRNHIHEATLKIHYWNGTNWTPCQTTGVNTAENYVWANITHFTTYTAIGIIMEPSGHS
jgi:hypothetical protein